MKPIIGLTMHLDEGRMQINEVYIQSIIQAGGIPVCLPFLKKEEIDSMIKKLDGLLLIGGNDFDPRYYGEDPHLKIGAFLKVRDESDFAMFHAAFERELPILGICRGLQLINVALGGTLYQDIPSQLPLAMAHSQASKRGETTQQITLLDGKLKSLFNSDKIYVNSFHHQAIKDVGAKLKVVAKTSDGVIEALEHESHPYCVSVQWHPEELAPKGDLYAQKLFESFIKACQK